MKNVQKRYGKKRILCGVDLSVGAGKCVGILGGNGSGKSTLLSVLAGVQAADDGEFLYDGNDLFKYVKQRRQLIGYVPQGTPLIEELTAADNLSLWYDKASMKKELADGVLSILGINEFLKVPVSKMSGGMKKRLSIGCAVAKKPPVLLLDEPMAALDLDCKQKIFEYIETHKKNGGIALLVTHDVLELELCDEVYILKNGALCRFEYDGSVENLIKSF